MRVAFTIAALSVFLCLSCKNTVGGKEKMAYEKADTSHLKNISHELDSTLIKGNAPVRSFYRENCYNTVWINAAHRSALLAAVKSTTDDGLLPDDYNLTDILAFENDRTISEADCVAYDILLTKTFRKLATHLFKGKLNPSSLYHDWALAGKKLDTNTLLNEALEEGNFEEVFDRCRPAHPIYGSLRESLAWLNSLPDDKALAAIEVTKAVTLKDSGAVVAAIQQRLVYWQDLDAADAVDNSYGRKTMKAVQRFQKRHGLYASGVVDKRTADALNVTKEQRREQVITNMERWRWFAYDFGEKAIVVNIPDYSLNVIENGKDTVQVFKVVVGKPERRSPILYSRLNQLTFNPTWTVPPTILKEDLVPEATEDRSYFANHRLTIYYGRDTIPTAPEDWDPQIADHYRYVQRPGRDNSLGEVKFNFRNGYYVYLHDTNHRELFTRTYRALSSGCVRVEDPFRLAEYVLDKEESGWEPEKMQELVALGETKNVGLKKSTHIHQLYWTAWKDKGGLQFRDDIYNLDKALYKQLRK